MKAFFPGCLFHSPASISWISYFGGKPCETKPNLNHRAKRSNPRFEILRKRKGHKRLFVASKKGKNLRLS